MAHRDILKQDIAFDFYTGPMLHELDTSSPDLLQTFMDSMCTFGTPQQETDESIHTKTQADNYVLNLKMENVTQASHAQQPFSRDELSMHIEKSFALLPAIPNFLGLLCIEYDNIDYTRGGDTLVVEQQGLLDLLTEQEKTILRSSYVQLLDTGNIAKNPILCADLRVGEFLCFRDAGNYGEHWRITSSLGAEGDSMYDDSIYEAIVEKMYTYLYTPAHIQRVPRHPGLLAIIDNKKFFHGKTNVHTYYARNLQRIRVV